MPEKHEGGFRIRGVGAQVVDGEDVIVSSFRYSLLLCRNCAKNSFSETTKSTGYIKEPR